MHGRPAMTRLPATRTIVGLTGPLPAPVAPAVVRALRDAGWPSPLGMLWLPAPEPPAAVARAAPASIVGTRCRSLGPLPILMAPPSV